MTNNPAIVRSLLVYAICLPVAIFLGFLLSDPLDKSNALWFAVGVLLLVLPLLLRWYHAWLIAIWNMTITFIYLPGLLPGWVPMACLGFAVALGHYILNRERKFLPSESVSASLVFLSLVVLVTAKMRGGLGFSALGDESVGGKRYLFIWVAVLGYFALISQPVPPRKRKLYTALFLLGAVTGAVNNLSTMIGPLGNFLYVFFPGMSSSGDTNPMAEANIERFGGIAGACMMLMFGMVAVYGIEGVLNLRKTWRPILFFSALVMSSFGGYRGIVVMVGITLVLVFCFEGLLRSRLMPVAVLGVIAAAGLVICFSDQLPLPVQRCLAVLPVKISPIAKLSAEASSDWRLDMWKSLLPEIPRYLFLGKGLTFDANDMAMYTTLGQDQVGGDVGGGMNLAADYHNGPLSVIIPFGIWGAAGFLWFLMASIKVLWKNYKYGDADAHKINTFLLCYFIAKTIMFMVVFGGFYGDLVGFAGIVGLSISLNRGVAAKPAPVTVRPQVVFNRFRRLPVGKPMPST
jgi:hypothetical protein